MVGDTGMEAGNKSGSAGPFQHARHGGHTSVDAGIHRARKESVCVRAAGGAGESWRGLCVQHNTTIYHTAWRELGSMSRVQSPR